MRGTRVLGSVDLGGTTVQAALADEQGRVLAEDSVPTAGHRGPDDVLERVARLVEDLAEQVGARPEAIGIGCPGVVDSVSGETRWLPNLATGWRGVPVRRRLIDALGCPIYLLNDVRMATLGELVYGHGAQRSSETVTMALFAIGTGIGGGIVVDGRLRLGPIGAAGELGHIVVEPDGPRCGCGGHGCLEALASAPALIGEGHRLVASGQAERLRELVEESGALTPREMAAAAAAGDEAVHEAIERAGRALGLAAAAVTVTLHPELIVVAGGVAQMGEQLLEPMRRTLAERVHLIPVDEIEVTGSLLGPRTGLLGGIALARVAGQV